MSASTQPAIDGWFATDGSGAPYLIGGKCQLVIQHYKGKDGTTKAKIDPATDNAAAIRAYEKVGFRSVGVAQTWWLEL